MLFAVEVDVPGSPAERAEATELLTRQLFSAGIDARLRPGEAPEHSKTGVAGTIGEIVVTGVLPAALIQAATQIILGYVRRDRSVTLKRGDDELKVGDLPLADRQKALKDFLSRMRSED